MPDGGAEFTPYLAVNDTGLVVTSASKVYNMAGIKAAVIIAGTASGELVARLPESVKYGASTFGIRAHVAAWRASVLPPGTARGAIEAGSTDGWRKYTGAADDPSGAVLGIDSFGESAPAAVLFGHFGLTADNLAATVRRCVAAAGRGSSP